MEEQRIETISIYDGMPQIFYDELNGFVDKIKKNINKDDKVLKEICEEINCFIKNLFHNELHSKEKQLSIVAKGSSSICYHSVYEKNEHLYLYKVFSPFSFCCNIPYKHANDVKDHFCFIPNCVESEHRRSILRRFVRFIRQKEEIDLCRQDEDVDEELFETPKLMFSSKGFVYEVELYPRSCTLEEVFRSENLKGQCNKENFKAIIKLVREAAEQVSDFCHKPKKTDDEEKVFHGDIKPENFIKIYTRESTNKYFVRNIDFDTWIRYWEIEAGFLKEFAATTRLYYDFNENTNPESLKDWFSYDIKALGRMLMYALSLMSGYEVPKTKFNWKVFFFGPHCYKGFKENEEINCPAKEIFSLLGSNKDLSSLFIFEQLRDLLLQCEDYKIKEIDEFIKKLNDIERLISNNPKGEIDNLFLRYLSLKRLDKEIENGTPFARQCVAEFTDEDGKINYAYQDLSGCYIDFNPKAKKEMSYPHLEFDFVEQVLNKAFKK